MRPIEVHKFGGTSVGSAERIAAVAKLMSEQDPAAHHVVVSSATSGTTNQLVALGKAASSGDHASVVEIVDGLKRKHLQIAQTLLSPPSDALLASLTAQLTELETLAKAACALREVTPRVNDRMLAVGEKLAVRLLAAALTEKGVPAIARDADTFLETDGRHGEAKALSGVADRTTRGVLLQDLEEGVMPIVTGFCGRSPSGETTTLGRGGSDLSATLIAAALDAREVTIWTDVDGIYSADPRAVPDARVIRQLNYREAAEMSYYGAKVLHQRTMIPVIGKQIPVRTRNSMNPSAPGSVVDGRFTPGSHPIKAVTAVDKHTLLSIEGKGMAGVVGISAKIFRVLAERAISATMISQSSSESSICIAFPEDRGDEALLALRKAFRAELSRGEVEEITLKPHVALLAVVGLGMSHVPGVAGQIMSALGSAGVNILAIAQGSSEVNITLAIEQSASGLALRSLHQAFGLHLIDTGEDEPNALDVLIMGLGNIGQRLGELIIDRSAHIQQRFGLRVRVVGISDRSGFVFEPTGLDSAALNTLIAHKRDRKPLAEAELGTAGPQGAMMDYAADYRLCRPILVDTTDSAASSEIFARAFERGCDVVTANKIPLAGPEEVFKELLRAAERTGAVLKAEATVGAGLPVIDTLDVLLATGDRLISAEGCLSGTLGFVMTALQEGQTLSEAVESAWSKGFTEPDPVADLSGMDVARKAVILGRLSGVFTDEKAVKLEGLVDPAWAGLPPAELFERLRTLDEQWTAKVNAAKAKGAVYRYMFRLTADGITVGAMEVSADTPAGRLAGTENLIVFRSDRYDSTPLVITGPGAGIDVTAMGVLGDILRISAERGGAK